MVKAKKMMFTSILAIVLLIGIAVSVVGNVEEANVILIHDNYYYTNNYTYLTAYAESKAGEPQHHRTISIAGSSYYGDETVNVGPYVVSGSNSSATHYVGTHADYYSNHISYS